MPTIYIEGQPYEVHDHRNLLEVALSLGLDLPYFCWHPALGSVGACRQCAVKEFKDENDKRGRLVMACMTPATDNTRISIQDPEAVQFRANVIEWLMVNHPHDCPVCDEGGECHLQDMTVMSGHNYRRYRYRKRTFRNQYLGPFINHEMNRCIACYRCVRFYRDYADGDDLQAMAAHNHVYFGRHEDGVLENEFSGNLVEVCPTGVFTDKTLKHHYTRKWDLQSAPSICQQCGLGCNVIAGERYGSLRRILNRYHHEVNGYFICDRGRFGYEFVNSEKRLYHPILREGETQRQVSKDAALQLLNAATEDPSKVIGVGSPRATLEANYALRELVGAERFYNGMTASESRLIVKIFDILKNSPVRSASLRDAEQADAVLVLGEDLTNTAPRLALALRQAARRQPKKSAMKLGIQEWHDAALREVMQKSTGPFYVATPTATKLDDVATRTYRAAPADIARLGFAVAHELNATAPAVPDLSEELQQLAGEIAGALREAERPVIVSGTSLNDESIIDAAANIAWALRGERPADICFTAPECNSLGMPFFNARNLAEAFQAVADGGVETVIVLENDLYHRAPASKVDKFLDAVEHVVVIDHLQHRTNSRAELLLPAATFAEGSGTVVNNEGRAQRFFRVFKPEGEIQESWRWIRDSMQAEERPPAERWKNLDALIDEMGNRIPALSAVAGIAPKSDFRIAQQKIPRASHRYSGRTAMNAHTTIYEPKPPADPDSPLSHSMEGFAGQPPSALIPFIWSPAWNSAQAINKFQSEVGGPLRGGDPGSRLLKPNAEASVQFSSQIPERFQRRDGEWLLVPLYHIFGSEELSVHSAGLAERVPKTYLALSPEDANALGVKDGEPIRITVDGERFSFAVSIRAGLPQGLAGFPVGLPDAPRLEMPVWSQLQKGGSNV